MKAFFRHCLAARLISSDPTAVIKPPKVQEEQVIPFTDEEMKRILEACDTVPSKKEALKLRAMVLLMRYLAFVSQTFARSPVTAFTRAC